jgi:hypothetical protein
VLSQRQGPRVSIRGAFSKVGSAGVSLVVGFAVGVGDDASCHSPVGVTYLAVM